MTAPDAMPNAALEFLAGDMLARRLVAAWPSIRRPLDSGADLYDEWSRLAGVARVIVEDRAAMLFENRICNIDGTVNEKAAAYVAKCALSVLAKNPRK